MRVVRQREDWDCGPAALATLTGRSYAACVAAASIVDPKHEGLYNFEVVDVALRLGAQLVPTRGFDRDHARGVLRVQWRERSRRGKASPGGHFVVLKKGMILDPHDGKSSPWRKYVSRHGARFGTLMELL